MKYYRVNKKNKTRLKREKMRNRRLVKKYPWLIPRNDWTGKIPSDYDYSYIEWGWTKGWDKAFGDMFMEELGQAINEAGLKNTYRILQIKEKYGQMRLYDNGGTDKINQIIDKYSHLSENICVGCGKPDVPMINDGWYSPWCYDCFRNNWKGREEHAARYREVNAATEDEILDAYNKCTCSEPKMADSYTILTFSKGEDIKKTYDISDTANKIRKRWIKNCGGRDG